MEKVIGALGESFMEANKGTTFTYNPTGSGSGIQAVSEGRCDIGLSRRALKGGEKAAGLKETIVALDGIAIVANHNILAVHAHLESEILVQLEHALLAVHGDEILGLCQRVDDLELLLAFIFRLVYTVALRFNMPAFML